MFLESMTRRQLQDRIDASTEFIERNGNRNFNEWEKLIRRQRPLPLIFFKTAKNGQKDEFLFVGTSKDGRALYTSLFAVVQTQKGKQFIQINLHPEERLRLADAITPHFIRRYRERGLGFEDCPPEKVLALFLSQNSMRVIVYKDPENPNVMVYASRQGLIIMNKEEEGYLTLKTYIDDEMLYKTQRMAKERMMEKMPDDLTENMPLVDSIIREMKPVAQEIYASYKSGAADYLVFRKTNTEEDVKLNFRLHTSEERLRKNQIKERPKEPCMPMLGDTSSRWTTNRFLDIFDFDGCQIDLLGDENGQGTLLFKQDGVIQMTYKGQLRNGKPDGIGVLTTDEGSTYEGEFVNAEPRGHIKHTFPGGKGYDEGIFKGFLRNGFCHRQVGSMHSWATYADGKRVGDIKLVTDDYTYEGEMKGDSFEGRCKVRFKDGYALEGVMKKGVLVGRGKEFREDGSIVEAVFKKGLPSGKGTQTLPDGTVLRGLFKDGELDGPVARTRPDGTTDTVDYIEGEPFSF